MFKDSKKSIVYISSTPKQGYKKIITSYKVIKENKKENSSILDVNLETGYVTCKNGKKERTVPIGNMSLKALKEYLSNARKTMIKDENEKALFVNVNGQRLTRQGFWKIIKYYKEQVIGVTGTKGKSTIVSLIYQILLDQNKDVRLLGNIGNPIFDEIESFNSDTKLVIEYFNLSSTLSKIISFV